LPLPFALQGKPLAHLARPPDAPDQRPALAAAFCLNRVLLALRSGRLDPDEADEVFQELKQVSIILSGGDPYNSDEEREAAIEIREPDLLWK
jgi:hypothetical protein